MRRVPRQKIPTRMARLRMIDHSRRAGGRRSGVRRTESGRESNDARHGAGGNTLVKQGKTATLGKLLRFGYSVDRSEAVAPDHSRNTHGRPSGKQRAVYHVAGTAQLGQVGTQFDGPGHVGIRTSRGDYFYNGREREQAYARGAGNEVTGMGTLGVEFVAEKGFVCRGLLFNAAAYKGFPRLPFRTHRRVRASSPWTTSRGCSRREHLDAPRRVTAFLYTGHGDLGRTATGRP